MKRLEAEVKKQQLGSRTSPGIELHYFIMVQFSLCTVRPTGDAAKRLEAAKAEAEATQKAIVAIQEHAANVQSRTIPAGMLFIKYK